MEVASKDNKDIYKIRCTGSLGDKKGCNSMLSIHKCNIFTEHYRRNRYPFDLFSIHYFYCPLCGAKNSINYIDKKTRRDLDDIDRNIIRGEVKIKKKKKKC